MVLRFISGSKINTFSSLYVSFYCDRKQEDILQETERQLDVCERILNEQPLAERLNNGQCRFRSGHHMGKCAERPPGAGWLYSLQTAHLWTSDKDPVICELIDVEHIAYGVNEM